MKIKIIKFIAIIALIGTIVSLGFAINETFKTNEVSVSSPTNEAPAKAQMCKIVWKIKLTGATGEGQWHPIQDEQYLAYRMREAQSRYPEIEHHLEYK